MDSIVKVIAGQLHGTSGPTRVEDHLLDQSRVPVKAGVNKAAQERFRNVSEESG